MLNDHFQRVQDGISNTYHLANLSAWILKHTKYEGGAFSFLGREFQKDIIDDPAKSLYVVKCAQVGLSEIFARWGLAATASQENFTTIYTFPAATDAELFNKSRMVPVIDGSAELTRQLSKSVNSVELKQFGQNSFLYTRGTFSETGALSVPADLLIHDEFDRSDMGNVAAYVSRLQAKPTKMRRVFSTPTVAKYGIDREASTTRRKKQVWTCSHCAHRWLPSYHTDVIIPGYDKDKKEITKANLHTMRWREARLLCPRCGLMPSSELRYREWVVENSAEQHDGVSYFVAPFCAPSVITPVYLVKSSTEYAKWSEFCNQALGETADNDQDMLSDTDVRGTAFAGSLETGELHYMGADMGLMCHITIGRMSSEGKLLVVHREKVYYTKFEERRRELCTKYRVLISVHDMFPYTDIISRITGFDTNAYGAVYVEKKSTEAFSIKEQEEDPEEGKLNVRAVHINRNVAFDELMADFKAKNIIISNLDEELVMHLLSMKRIHKYDKQMNMVFKWEKTDGVDHYHHSLMYLKVAVGLRGTASGYSLPGVVPLVTSFIVR